MAHTSIRTGTPQVTYFVDYTRENILRGALGEYIVTGLSLPQWLLPRIGRITSLVHQTHSHQSTKMGLGTKWTIPSRPITQCHLMTTSTNGAQPNVRSFNVESHGFHNCHVGNNATWGHKESEDVDSTGKTKAYSD